MGFANTDRLESKLQNLEAECVEEGKRDKLESGRFKLPCDPESLVDLERNSEPSVGVQARVAAAEREVLASERWPYVLAAGVGKFQDRCRIDCSIEIL